MRNVTILVLLICLSTISGRTQNVGIGTTTPDSSAQLHIEASNKGLLPPRLTIQQRNAILNPAEGLQIYNLTTGIPEVYSRGEWRPFASSSALNFYDNFNDKDGFIQSDSIDYSCLIKTDKALVIMDFDCDSSGNQVFFLQYNGRQYFYGQQLECIDGATRYALIKISRSGTLIWYQNIGFSNGGQIQFAKIRILNDGNMMLALSHYIGLGVTTNYSYTIGNQDFSFNSYYGNIIKLTSEGQYLSHKSMLNTRLVYFDVNQNLVGAYVYEAASPGGGLQQATLMNCNDPSLSTIWDKQFTTYNVLWSFGLHPTENNLYYTYTRNQTGLPTTLTLARLTSSGSQNLLALGTGGSPGSPTTSVNTITFLKGNIHIITPENWSITFNSVSYTKVLHVVISNANNSILNISAEDIPNAAILTDGIMKKTGDFITEIIRIWSSSGSGSMFFLFKIYDNAGIIKYRGIKNVIGTNTSPIFFRNISSYENKMVIGGYYRNNNDELVSFLDFTFPAGGSNGKNPFVLFLNLPN